MTRTALSRRTALKATGGLVSGLSLSGCLGSAPTAEESTSRTFQMIGQPLRTLDPAQARDSASTKLVSQLYDGLVHYPKAALEPELLLAEDVGVSADGTTYTFELKRDVAFSDGSTLTAADVVYTFERLAGSPHSQWRSTVLDLLGIGHETRTVETADGTRDEYVPHSLAVDALDDHRVRMRLTEPFYDTLAVLAHPAFGVVPEGTVGDVEGYDGRIPQETFATSEPVGAGPFTLDVWEQGTEYRVRARSDYHRSGPVVAGIHWQVISDPTSGFTYALNGNADAFWIPDEKFDQTKVTVDTVDEAGRRVGHYGPLRNGATVQYLQVPQMTTFYIGFNAARVERPVRRAVAYALNQQTDLDQVHENRGITATHLTPPNLFPEGVAGYEKHAEEYPYGADETRLEEARTTLAEAGYTPESPAEVTFTTYESAAWQATSRRLRDKLASVGVELTLEQAPFNTLGTRGEQGSLEMFSWGWGMDYPAAENFVQLLAPSNGAEAFTHWEGSTAADSAQAAWERIEAHRTASESDQAVRAEACRTMEEANWKDVVLLPKYHPIGEGFYYPWVDVPKTGAAGFSKHKYTDVRVSNRD
ncbi:peptide/nickel transport system substrate-binding protein [Halogranum amylolyticum]|uniref:Peptide/nickel transport system substrate-binding protein n=1 Tax=Halogranum amylolyticum TaxID=660520 RepID=A0A1H8SKL2_9EURY|nr:ABC transporter substrate-binding protein [Halogranum amylolyticum]SEO79097.1 peptide/nickel transport system substrate-binding protein [Halogranum amylolyticum]